MKVCKCRICKKELKFPENNYCKDCITNCPEKINEYEAKLEKRRKYICGDKITSIEQFDNAEFVYWGGKVYHKGFIQSMPYHVVKSGFYNGWFYFAVKKRRIYWKRKIKVEFQNGMRFQVR